MPIETKQSAPQVSDSALRMNADFPELPEAVTKRFPEMESWAKEVDKFWRQNVNAVGDFARAVLDVTEIAGVLVVDAGDGSLSINRTTRKKGAWIDADTPFYVDRDGFFSLGSRLGWDPRENTLTIEGTIIADAGVIGGWNISPNSLTSGTGATTVGLDSGGTNPAIYAGSATPGSAPFRVTQAGALFASNATISGSITATSGAIGGWTIGATTLSGGNAVLSSAGTLLLGTGNNVVVLDANDATYRIWVGNATAGSAAFSVTKAGALFASTATFAGAVTITTTNELLVSSNASYFTWQGSSIGSPGIFFQHDAASSKGLSLLGVGSTTATSTILGFNKARGSFGAFSNVSTDDIVGSIRFFSYTGVGPWQALAGIRSGITNSINTPFFYIDVGPSAGATSYWVFNYDGKLYFSDSVPANAYGSPYVSDSLANLYRSAAGTVKTDGVFISSGGFSGSGASLTSLNASNLSSGTVPTARLGSGSATSGTWLRGDQTWSAIAAANVSGLAASATTDTTNASNISSGTLGRPVQTSIFDITGASVDVDDVNLRVRVGGSNVVVLNKDLPGIVINGNQVVGTRQPRGGAGLSDVVALLDAWGAWA